MTRVPGLMRLNIQIHTWTEQDCPAVQMQPPPGVTSQDPSALADDTVCQLPIFTTPDNDENMGGVYPGSHALYDIFP